MVIADGFFVSSSKATGSVKLVDLTNYPKVDVVKISTDKKANFYHHAEWVDMDRDGNLDVVAARAYKSINPFSKAEG